MSLNGYQLRKPEIEEKNPLKQGLKRNNKNGETEIIEH